MQTKVWTGGWRVQEPCGGAPNRAPIHRISRYCSLSVPLQCSLIST